MSDIFISYSRKDSARAEQLAELFRSAGFSVWIDQTGIEAATSWSEMIVDAIDTCTVLVLLLSNDSIVSHNVVKEVSLASEKRKKILPIDLEPVTLPNSLQYPLAGLQRAPMTNIDSIIRALAKLGLIATSAPTMKIVRDTPGKKSVMTLPFQDHSPTGDNGWFADGIVSELIAQLSRIKALRVSDPQATKEFKHYKGQLTTYANEMNIRYFVMGSVRKFGDQVKIAVQLLDIETGEYLWQDSLKGVMDDIFDIQESVALKVVEGLKVHLAEEERKHLSLRGTENSEAYELYMKASEYTDRHTKESFQHGITLIEEAIRLDPKYAEAHRFLAHALCSFYRLYDRDINLVERANSLVDRALELKPTLLRAYEDRCLCYLYKGELEKSEQAARQFIELSPDEYSSHFALAFFYMETNEPAKAVVPFEAALRLKPDHLSSLFNICLMLQKTKDERLQQWSNEAIHYYERKIRLSPDSDGHRMFMGALLNWAGRREEAVKAVAPILAKHELDPLVRYNLACFYADLGEHAQALQVLRQSVEEGFVNPRLVEGWLKDEWVKMSPTISKEIEELLAHVKSKQKLETA